MQGKMNEIVSIIVYKWNCW